VDCFREKANPTFRRVIVVGVEPPFVGVPLFAVVPSIMLFFLWLREEDTKPIPVLPKFFPLFPLFVVSFAVPLENDTPPKLVVNVEVDGGITSTPPIDTERATASLINPLLLTADTAAGRIIEEDAGVVVVLVLAAAVVVVSSRG